MTQLQSLKRQGLTMEPYKVLMHEKTFQKAKSYLKDLGAEKNTPGSYLKHQLGKTDLSHLDIKDFIERLVRTKKPQIFAESSVSGDGTDWNLTELSILGDVGIAVPVQVFDNGMHSHPQVHEVPFKATLLYIPGALLRNGRGKVPVDWNEVTKNEQIHGNAYNDLYERRLLPSFVYVNDVAKSQNRKALITLPGIGCGQFAGKFRGQLGERLKNAIVAVLEKHGQALSHIKAVYYDPHRSCKNERLDIHQTVFLVRPLAQGNEKKSQLCPPETYQDSGDDFSGCDLFSFVAWDHVSWPGNDFYVDARATDDGVKAAATDSMAVLTGVKGAYNPRTNKYDPPGEYGNWDEVVSKTQVQLNAKNNLWVLPETFSIEAVGVNIKL